jgi:ribosome-associated protein
LSKKKSSKIESQKLVDAIVAGMQEKKGNKVTVIDLNNIANPLADFFVICSGNSDKQVDAISESVEKFTLLQASENPWRTEGKRSNEWVILDYVNVVAHVFQDKKRSFYGLEELWGDGRITVYDDATNINLN